MSSSTTILAQRALVPYSFDMLASRARSPRDATRRARRWLARLAGVAPFVGLALVAPSADARDPALLQWSTLRWHGREARAEDQSGKAHALHLESNLQAAARTLLTRAKPAAGAAVLVDVKTGNVLAAAEIGSAAGGSLLFEPIAPAASVFKLVTTIALYERSDVTPKTRVCTRGGIRSVLAEHLEPARGPDALCAPFYQALGRSRNAVFAQLATQKLMPRDLVEVSDLLGFNRALSLEASGRVGSLVVPAGDLDFARTATGFENSRLSVFGAAHIALSIATGGVERPMHLSSDPEFTPATPSPLALPAAASSVPGSLPSIETLAAAGFPVSSLTPSRSLSKTVGDARPATSSPTDARASEPRPSEPRRLFSARTADRVTRAMEYTVRSGTAQSAFTDEHGKPYLGTIHVAGKTGTLQADTEETTASWFVGFAPSERPEIVVSVVLQNTALWHQKGHQVARDLLRAYFASRGTAGVTSPLPAAR